MLWSGCFGIVAIAFGAAGTFWAAGLAGVTAIVAVLWAALAQETPSVSLTVLTMIVGAVVGTAAVAEKWPQARAYLHLAPPATPSVPSTTRAGETMPSASTGRP